MILPVIRGVDRHGSGYYRAPRSGGRVHNGVDCCSNLNSVGLLVPGDIVRSMARGVARIGRVYPDPDPYKYQLVAIRTPDGFEVKHCYLEPIVRGGDHVEVGQPIGRLQRLHYDGITQHVHLGVKRIGGAWLDPIPWLCGAR